MASADVGALLDIASSAPQSDPTPVEPVETEVSGPIEGEVSSESGQPEGDTEKPVDGRTTPAQIRTALKEFRDLKPENAPIARQLNDAFGRYTAYKQEFPTVASAREARVLLDAVGGNDGLATLQQTVKSVNDTDQALYSGDGRVIKTLYEDMKAAGHPEALTKLAGPYLDLLQEVDPKGFVEAYKPYLLGALQQSNFPGVVQDLMKVLSSEKPDIATLKAIVEDMQGWYSNLDKAVEGSKKTSIDPERQAFEKERTEFQTQKQTEFQNSVATACETTNNRELGTELGKYLRNPYFKTLSKEGKSDLGYGLKQQLFSELKADKAYQSQMDAFFSVPNPDKAKIQQYHDSKVKTMAPRIVKSVVERRYPGYNAKVAPKPAVAAKTGVTQAAQPQTKPRFLTSRPPQEQLDLSKDPDRYLMISGRGYLKSTGQFITWNPKYK